jgi:hypothetical protein
MKTLSELRSELDFRYREWETSGLIAAIVISRHSLFISYMDSLEFWIDTEMFKHDYIRNEHLKLPRLIKR